MQPELAAFSGDAGLSCVPAEPTCPPHGICSDAHKRFCRTRDSRQLAYGRELGQRIVERGRNRPSGCAPQRCRQRGERRRRPWARVVCTTRPRTTGTTERAASQATNSCKSRTPRSPSSKSSANDRDSPGCAELSPSPLSRQGSYDRAAEEIERAMHSEPEVDRNAYARNADVLATALLFGPTGRSRRVPTGADVCVGSTDVRTSSYRPTCPLSLAGLEAMQGQLRGGRERSMRGVDCAATWSWLSLRMARRRADVRCPGSSSRWQETPRRPSDELRAAPPTLESMVAHRRTPAVARPQCRCSSPWRCSRRGATSTKLQSSVLRCRQRLAEADDVPAQILTWTCRSRIDLQRGRRRPKALETREGRCRCSRTRPTPST